MSNHEKDRHVLAAAVCGQIETIITFNLKDFKPANLNRWGIAAVHPQEYLLALHTIKPKVVLMKISDIARKKGEPFQDTILTFGQSLPQFSRRLIEDFG